MDPAEYGLMDAVEDRMWWYRALHARLLDALADASGRLLDAGCGTGGFLARLRADRADLECIGMEWDEEGAVRAKAKAGVPIARGSVNALPFADSTFSVFLSADVFCHRSVDPAAALAEARRVLRPGGRIVLNMPAFMWMMAAHDRRVHTARRVTTGEMGGMLRQAGFTAVRARYWNSLLFPLMVAQRKLFTRQEHHSDVVDFPPWLDATFHAVTQIERSLPFPMPAGGSVMAIAERA